MMNDVASIPELKQSLLGERHASSGARMGVIDGFSVPLAFGDVDEEYASVRTLGAGLIDLSSRGRINVVGAEALQFLNGLITNDVKTLEVGMWMPAAFPNVQGRLLATVRVLHRKDGYLFDTESATHETVFKTLERFTLAGDFRVTDLTDELATISVQGARAAEIVEVVLGGAMARVEYRRIVESKWNEHSVFAIRASHTSEDGFDFFTPPAAVVALWDALSRAGAQPVGADALEILRIEAGLPIYGADFDSSNVVLESGLDDTVSFTKGCYVGQEIIARIHWRGHVAKRIAGVVMDEPASIRRDEILHSIDGKEIGRVTSTCFSPHLQRTIALCMVKFDYLAPDTPVFVLSDNGQLAGRVVELPFVRASWNDPSLTASVNDK